MSSKVITVFGSSLPRPGEPQYEDAYHLGKLLAEAGYSICCGGNHGIMEAAAKGAVEAGQNAIGITTALFSAGPNRYITKHVRKEALMDRLEALVEYGAGYVILQGGTGTLLELALVWELMNKSAMPIKPVVCHSVMWKRMVDIMEEQIVLEGRAAGLITPCETIPECVHTLRQRLEKNN